MRIRIENGIMPKGVVKLPPSKSEAIRAALLLGLSGEDPRRAVEGFDAPFCADMNCALLAAEKLDGAFVGESAALMRMLIPVQAALFGRVSVLADEALLKRGFGEIEECLGVSLTPAPGTAFIDARAPITGDRFTIDCSRTSQFLSGLLIALPLLDRECELIVKNGLVSKPYAEMTLDFVRLFGGAIEETETGYRTFPSAYRAPEVIPVTGDASYAAVFEAMNVLGGEVNVVGKDENTRQPDKDFLKYALLRDADISDCPDIAPLLAAVACSRTGDTVIRGTARLRTKESDREAGAVCLIRDLGGEAEAGRGCVIVHGGKRLSGGECCVQNDHRLAFAAAVMALISDSPVSFEGAECAAKSAASFWEDCKELGIVN